MVKIKLQRRGKKGEAHYRVVVANSTSARDSMFIEDLGFFNPHKDPAEFSINIDLAKEWLKKGAKPTETVAQYFVKLGLISKLKKGSVLATPKPKKKTAKEASAS